MTPAPTRPTRIGDSYQMDLFMGAADGTRPQDKDDGHPRDQVPRTLRGQHRDDADRLAEEPGRYRARDGAAPSTAPSAPNTRPRWLSAVARWSSVKPPASVSAPGTPTDDHADHGRPDGHVAQRVQEQDQVHRAERHRAPAEQQRRPEPVASAAAIRPPAMPPTAWADTMSRSPARCRAAPTARTGANSVPMMPSPTQVTARKTSTTRSTRCRAASRSPSAHSARSPPARRGPRRAATRAAPRRSAAARAARPRAGSWPGR